MNATSPSGVYLKVLSFFKREKIRKAFPVNVAINLKRDAILPVRCWTSSTDVGLFISMIARHLSGFASITWYVSMKPRNFSASTANMQKTSTSLTSSCCAIVGNWKPLPGRKRGCFLPWFWPTCRLHRLPLGFQCVQRRLYSWVLYK